MDEDVFETRGSLANLDPGSRTQGSERSIQRGAIMTADMQRRPEEGDMFDSGFALQLWQKLANIGAFDNERGQTRLSDDVLHRAARYDVAEIDEDDAVTAFSLVHVMGTDEDREAALA